MSIRLCEKPVISIDTGKVLGTLKGLIYKDQRITFLYCQFSNQYVYIPIQDAVIGSDAIMLKVMESIEILSTDTPTKVYTEDGKELGTVASIEIDDAFNITGIMLDTDDLFIGMNKILHMGNIIIVENTKEEMITEKVNDHELDQQEEDIPDQYEEEPQQQTDTVDYKLLAEEASTAEVSSSIELPIEVEEDGEVIKLADETFDEEEEVIENDKDNNQEQEPEDELSIEIDPRYKHLCGKKLLADISILKETFQKGTIIDAALIQFAIINNAIVKVIMNTDD